MSAAAVRLAPLTGILGAAVTIGTTVAAAIVYRGADGEAYSPLNHWVSELGEVGVSSLARLFNAGLMVGGTCFALFMVGLAAAQSGRPRYPLALLGAIAGVAGILVGVFPINTLTPHAISATTFLSLASLTVVVASLDVWRRPDPRFPQRLVVIGGLTAVAYGGFLVALAADGMFAVAAFGPPEVRRALWFVATLEWLTLVGIIAWVLVLSVAWRRAGSPAAPR